MKTKTHSGAKKRLRPRPTGTIKRKRVNRRHLLEHKKAKRKRQLAKSANVDPANLYQVSRCLVI